MSWQSGYASGSKPTAASRERESLIPPACSCDRYLNEKEDKHGQEQGVAVDLAAQVRDRLDGAADQDEGAEQEQGLFRFAETPETKPSTEHG